MDYIETLKKEVVEGHNRLEVSANKAFEIAKLVVNIVVPVISLVSAVLKLKR